MTGLWTPYMFWSKDILIIYDIKFKISEWKEIDSINIWMSGVMNHVMEV